LMEGFHISAENIVCIYNPVDVERINNIANMGENPFADKGVGPHIVTAGRLYNQKGFDRLMRAFPALLKLRSGAQLWILGQGPRESEYKGLRVSLGLADCVHFVGFQKNPYKWFKHADLFVLSSRYEGLPNALLEAIACGCPVLAIDHPGGTREILALLGQLSRLTPRLDWDSRFFVRPSKVVVSRLVEHFGVKTIVGHYSELLEGG
jgi:glycosyltransferase involved in cell wall biosynthesis